MTSFNKQSANSVINKLKIFYKLSDDKDIAEKLGISPATLSNWKRRNTYDSLLIIDKCKDIDLNWLFQSDSHNEILGSHIVNEPVTDYGNGRKITPSPFIMNVPIVSNYAYAGYLSGFSHTEFMDNLPTMPFFVDREYKGKYVAFEVRGDSMNDGSIDSYLPGDIVLGREVHKMHWHNKLHINRWDFIIVHNTDGILIKKITDHNPETGDIVAHSLNSDYEDIKMNLKDVWQLFNVVRVERNK